MKNKRIILKEPPSIISAYTVVGKKEHDGILGSLFDEYSEDNKFFEKSWEKAEGKMQQTALAGALRRAKMPKERIDLLIAGDLLNQCVASHYGLLPFDVPHLGIYGACSNCAEGLALSAVLCGNGSIQTAGVVTSSHFCSSERQFRFPLEYGGQRTPTSQWTVTGSGAYIVGKGGTVEIPDVLFGKINDLGVTDINNMGSAMAPSAFDTLRTYFHETETTPADYDLIVTGDLGYEGSEILKELFVREERLPLCRYADCGLMIYDRKREDVHAGGSGCGCSAVVLGAQILKRIEDGQLHNVLFVGTGALMSPLTVFQGASIPSIAHLVHLRRKE